MDPEHAKTLINHWTLPKRPFRVVLLKWHYLIMDLFTVVKNDTYNYMNTMKFYLVSEILLMKFLYKTYH